MTRYLKSGLHLMTALLGMYWGIFLTLMGLYGAPFSLWYGLLFVGGVVLGTGVLLDWFVRRKWTQWLILLGSALLAAYFIPAAFFNAREMFAVLIAPTSERLFAVAAVILTFASLLMAIQTARRNDKLLRNR